jgi:hypothetical protein
MKALVIIAVVVALFGAFALLNPNHAQCLDGIPNSKADFEPYQKVGSFKVHRELPAYYNPSRPGGDYPTGYQAPKLRPGELLTVQADEEGAWLWKHNGTTYIRLQNEKYQVGWAPLNSGQIISCTAQ